MNAVEHLKATLVGSESVAEATRSYTFQLQEGFWFRPGQYVTLALPILKDISLRESARDLSIASAPEELPLLTLALRDGESPFKVALQEMRIGAHAEIHGPKGIFTLPEDPTPSLCFIAGGIGITPFRSMVRHLVAQGESRAVSLYYYNHSDERAAFIEEFTALGQRLRLQSYIGSVTESSLPLQVEAGAQWYIAGPPPMVSSAYRALHVHGVESARIHMESFTGYE